MPLQSVNTQYNSDGYVKKNKMTLKESAMLVFNLLKISFIVEFLPAGWFSSENDAHLNVENVDKDTTKKDIMRKPESPALSESMRKPAAHAAASYSETVRKASRQTADYLPAVRVQSEGQPNNTLAQQLIFCPEKPTLFL